MPRLVLSVGLTASNGDGPRCLAFAHVVTQIEHK